MQLVKPCLFYSLELVNCLILWSYFFPFFINCRDLKLLQKDNILVLKIINFGIYLLKEKRNCDLFSDDRNRSGGRVVEYIRSDIT